jgi:hypothetical protein
MPGAFRVPADVIYMSYRAKNNLDQEVAHTKVRFFLHPIIVILIFKPDCSEG